MKHAFVLINCDVGSERVLIEQLKRLNSVSEVHGTFGAYDMVVKVESEKPETINQTITEEIRKLEHVRSTLTLMGIEDIAPQTNLDEIIPDVIPEEKEPLETKYDEDDEYRT